MLKYYNINYINSFFELKNNSHNFKIFFYLSVIRYLHDNKLIVIKLFNNYQKIQNEMNESVEQSKDNLNSSLISNSSIKPGDSASQQILNPNSITDNVENHLINDINERLPLLNCFLKE